MNFIFIILISVMGANLSIIFISLVGVFLVITKTINPEFVSWLGRMLEMVFVPCIIITSFLRTITIGELYEIIPIIFSASFVCLVGGVVGFLSSQFWIKDQYTKSIVILACANPHTASIQLQITYCLRHLLEKLQESYNYESTVNTTTRAITTIMIFSTVNNTYRWTINKYIFESLAPKKEEQNEPQTLELESLPPQTQIQSEPLMVELPILELQNQDYSAASTQADELTIAPVENLSILKKLGKVYTWISELSMPMLAIFLSLVIVCIYPIQRLLLNEDSFAHQALFQPIETVGKACTPCNLIMLGANMCNIIQKGQIEGDGLDKKICLKITFTKLVIVPIFGMFFLYLMVIMKILNDPVVIFVNFLTYITPSTVNILIMIKRYKGNENVVSLILVQSYVCAIFTLPIWIMIFVSIQM